MNITIDEEDLFIIERINQKDTNTRNIAKSYFKIYPEKEINRVDRKLRIKELDNQTMNINNRLKKMSKWGIVLITEELSKFNTMKHVYNLIDEKIKIGKHKFPDKYSKHTICLNIYGKWCAFEIG